MKIYTTNSTIIILIQNQLQIMKFKMVYRTNGTISGIKKLEEILECKTAMKKNNIMIKKLILKEGGDKLIYIFFISLHS